MNPLFFKIGVILQLFFLFAFPAKSQIALTKVDEFQINSLLDVTIVDYSSINQRFLGFIDAPSGEKIVVIDNDGNIVNEENLKGEGPNQYITNLNAMAFSENGDIWLQTVTDLFLYDISLKKKEKIPYPSSVQIQIYRRKEFFSFYSQDSKKDIISFVTNPSGSNSYMPNASFNENLIEIYDVENKKLNRIAPVLDRLMKDRLDGSLQSTLYFLVYSLDRKNKKLILTSRLDDEITIYDLETNKLSARIKIEHGDFDLMDQKTISAKDLKSTNGISLGSRNHKIFSLDEELIVLDYLIEIAEGIFEQKKINDPEYSHLQDPNYHRLIFFDQEKQLSDDVPMPNNGTLMAILPGQKLLFKISDPEVEEDFIQFEIYQVVKK